ncbi:uncharacterized protein [Polyergus mexicanus]|uniref:uncharacterized protein n=1 Tax=Polyergus mexicanus TaxID=615972 RepID=UPI0038B41DA6
MQDLLQKQGSVQHSIERSLSNFKKIGKSNVTAPTIRSRLAHLQESWMLFQDGHAQLLKAVPLATRPTVSYFKDNVRDAVEDIYQQTRDYMTNWLEELEPIVSENQSLNASVVGLTDASALNLSYLPPIKLPPFDGTYSDWENFRDRFLTLIVKNKSLTDFARMHYLSSSLKGRALDAISNIPVTADNFSSAWDALSQRFENPRRLLAHHFNTLLGLPVSNKESASDLQSLIDKINISVASMKQLKRTPSELWDDFLVHLAVHRLDSATRKAWTIRATDSDTPPTYEALCAFVRNRIRALDECTPQVHSKSGNDQKAVGHQRVSASTASASSPITCPLCRSKHLVNKCSKFIAQTPIQRRETVKSLKRCFNCLSSLHSVQECKSRFSCRSCNKRHHSMLHTGSDSEPGISVSPAQDTPPPVPFQLPSATVPAVNSLSASAVLRSRPRVLLATARVHVASASGHSVVVRAMLDQGSEATFISEALAQTLRLQRIRMPTSISGVGGCAAGTARQAAYIKISPLIPSSAYLSATALILPSLTTYAPHRVVDKSALSHLYNLAWADPDPTSTESIDLLIGADLCCEAILEGVRKGQSGYPVAQQTIFGWVISGPVPDSATRSSHTVSVHHCTSLMSLSEDIQKFWEIEELPSSRIYSPQDEQCEAHFVETHSRDASGRYIVRLPFKSPPPLAIGDSKRSAERLLQCLLRRFKSQPDLYHNYLAFMTEYETLGHMRRVADDTFSSHSVYIPHHPVTRADSATTRLRVVFNASYITSNGSSLNDHLLVGPKLQTDLRSIIVNWRQFRYVYIADIAKMYRQILLDSRDVNFQRIKWQPAQGNAPCDFQLLTVTYGMACAPFLALRVLKCLGDDEGNRFPLAASILKTQIYVDDVIFGDNQIEALRVKRDQLIALLRCGQFELRKWASNSSVLLADIDPSDHGLACHKDLSEGESVKVLGIIWNPANDAFQFKVSTEPTTPNTKRSILSVIARLYDPLGWVTPATVAAKLVMQQLWRAKIGWDEVIPDAIMARWQILYSTLPNLNRIVLPRWMNSLSDSAELHGFADASTHAYAAAVYMRVTNSDGRVFVSLIAGKSKVAAISPMTVPRLELSAALLLSRLITFIRDALNLHSAPCFGWTDSTIVLAWLRSHPSRWKTFVANRVANIQTTSPYVVWRHVPTATNSADCASRGLSSAELLNHHLWWDGPPWLRLPSDDWPAAPEPLSDDSSGEEKLRVCHAATPPVPWDLASRFSSWPKLIRVTAHLFRFIHYCRRLSLNSTQFPGGSALSAAEFSKAKVYWLKQIQFESFPAELRALRSGNPVSIKSSLAPLTPFLDRDGLLRAGGRLHCAPLPYDSRHPIVLTSHPLVRLIASHAHLRSLHGGTQLTLSVLRKEYWILRARTLVKSIIHACVPCVRERAAVPQQLMGNLPAVRVSPPPRSFAHCGVDYAGPIKVRSAAGRGIKSHKSYVALFICLATRAIHLELVGDYSTAAFIQALNRFSSRRGLPQAIYSDNGTTFVGADRELSKAYRKTLRDPQLLNITAGDNISWHFIPPSAPHFGGL